MNSGAPATHNSQLTTRNSCDYCGLSFTGQGFSPGNGRTFCCYGCHLVERITGTTGEEGIASWILVRLGIGAFLAMNVMMISLVLYTNSTSELGEPAVRGLRWAMLILSTPAVVILGSPFLLGAARDLRRLRLSTDALIATGSLAAFGVSAFNVVHASGNVYFDTATMLLLIVTLGRLLEASAKHKTSTAIRDLIDLTPSTATVLRDGAEIEIPSADVSSGDLMIVKPGERLPADGRIVSGECLIEASVFTGESNPRSCSPGVEVFGGSINIDGYITVRATAVGSQSLLCQIQRMVWQAQNDRAPIERLTERITSVFVPAVWLTAASSAAYWGLARGNPERAWLSALAVLVVACPCALGLATPMATCLAIGRAARGGVLVRSGDVLERLLGIRKVFMDKTGTLTDNRLTVREVRPISEGTSADEVLAWAATLEAAGGHSIGRAIVEAAHDLELERGVVADVKTYPGRGIAGSITLRGETRRVSVGNLSLFREECGIPDAISQDDDPLTKAYVAWGGQVRAAIILQDTEKSSAARAIDELKARGIEPVIVSGDRLAPTIRVAESLGVDQVLAERTPAQKAESVRGARETGAKIAMVGDGINDAPALAEADVGIAVAEGTDLAREASDITLLGDDLGRIPWALELAEGTYRIIRQNLWWAFGYNGIAIVLAFFGFVHPLIAAGAMVLSSLAVIANSMRLYKSRT